MSNLKTQDLQSQCQIELTENLRRVENRAPKSGELNAWCERCKNPLCIRAQGGLDPFTARVQTQEQRIFNTPIIPQTEISKWKDLSDFQSVTPDPDWKPSAWVATGSGLVVPKGTPRNTPAPMSGIMVGGGEAPPTPPSSEPQDPWASPKWTKVAPGAKIRVGADGKIIK